MSIGNHTDSDNLPWWFEVTTASFSIPVSASTCQTAMVNNGSNTVDFGEVMASDIRDTSFFPRKYFSLQLRGCNNVTAIQYKV
ncbi:fimbrial protein, partial [Escherichia coli]|nr:fimbrial protein [Escherichia coli]